MQYPAYNVCTIVRRYTLYSRTFILFDTRVHIHVVHCTLYTECNCVVLYDTVLYIRTITLKYTCTYLHLEEGCVFI